MCLKDLRGILCRKQDKLKLLLLNITAEHAQEILDLCCDEEEEIRFINLHNDGISLESSSKDLRTIALDLGDEGAHIKIDPSVSASLIKRGFIQTHPYAHRHAPSDWELGNHLSTSIF